MKSVAVTILNWNGVGWLEQFLPSVVKYTPSDLADIVVIDNASTDTSVDFLQKNYPKIELIRLSENYGFSEGYNQGLKFVDNPYAVLLNSDVEVAEGWLQPLLEYMEQHPETASCQPTIKSYHDKKSFEYAGAAGGYLDGWGYAFCRGRIFDIVEEDTGQYNTSVPIFWASGACMMVRTLLFKKLGGFDKRFFAHMEEIDLCWRMQRAGYQIQSIPQSTVYHVGGGTLDYQSPRKMYLNFRNSLWMCYKNWEGQEMIYKLPIRLILDGIAGLQMLLHGSFRNCGAIIKAHFSFYARLLSAFQCRQQSKHLIQQHARGNSRVLPYRKSIIIQFFIKGKKKFQDLS